MKYTLEDIEDIKYFHEYKGDIERFSSWERIKEDIYRDYPELRQALEAYTASSTILDLVIDNLEYKER